MGWFNQLPIVRNGYVRNKVLQATVNISKSGIQLTLENAKTTYLTNGIQQLIYREN